MESLQFLTTALSWIVNNNFAAAWFFGIPAIFFLSCLFLRVLNLWPGKTEKGTRVSDLMAFLIAAGICVAYLAIAGIISFFALFGVNDIYVLESDPAYGHSDFVANHLVIPMIFYQGWNTLICMINKDLIDWLMVGHHVIACTLAVFALHPFLHRDAIFFFGISEITSVLLTILDFFRYDPTLRKKFSVIEVATQGIFVVMFFSIRVFYWNYHNIDFYKRLWSMLSDPNCHSQIVVAIFLVSNVLLTFLQLYWGILIIQQVHGVIMGPSTSAQKSD